MQYKPSTKPSKADEEEEDEDFPVRQAGFRVKSTPQAMRHVVHVNEAFVSVKQFEPLVAILDNANEGDIVEIKLTTPGGAVQAVLPTLSAIASTQATVFVHAVSDVASAGTFLLMLADDVFVNPYVTVMFHQVTFGAYGQGNHVVDRVGYVNQHAGSLLGDMYKDFFTHEEMQQMLTGKEFWLSKGQFDERYEARFQINEARLAAAVKAQQATIDDLTEKPVKAKKQRKAE